MPNRVYSIVDQLKEKHNYVSSIALEENAFILTAYEENTAVNQTFDGDVIAFILSQGWDIVEFFGFRFFNDEVEQFRIAGKFKKYLDSVKAKKEI